MNDRYQIVVKTAKKRLFSGYFNHPYCISRTVVFRQTILAACSSESFGMQQSNKSSSICLVDLTTTEHQTVPMANPLVRPPHPLL